MRGKSFFYPRLALSNMKKNGSIYLPYLMAGILLSGLYYMVLAVGDMVSESEMAGGDEMQLILQMCSRLCIAIIFLILFYINSFVMKRRKRELGLYCILGMEKRHLCVLLFWEVFFSAGISILGGILFGALFSQFMFLVLLKLVQIPAKLTFAIPLSAVGTTFLVFCFGYLATLLFDWLTIVKTNPIALLKSRQEGEREPKTKWLTALLGTVTLAAGYGIALKTRSASEGLFFFFPAALLVIIATYCLFLAGSIVLLKFLRKRKRFYYRPENFISVSGMLYRMKQNAAGLATIAILSTALLVVLSSAVSLYWGEEDKLMGFFPREYRMWTKPDSFNEGAPVNANQKAEEWKEEIFMLLEGEAAEKNVRLTDAYSLFCTWWTASRTGSSFDSSLSVSNGEEIVSLTLILLSDYNEMTYGSEKLDPDEILYIGPSLEDVAQITIDGNSFRVKKQVPCPKEMPSVVLNQDTLPAYIAVVSDMNVLMDLYSGAPGGEVEYYTLFDLKGEPDAQKAFAERIPLRYSLSGPMRFETRTDYREKFYMLYGSIMFVGILFSCMFLIATVLIIYYKQVTEGYDDRERYQIMEKVGMRDAEIRSAIQKQVLLVFFLPLAAAVAHICVAARVLRLFLSILGLSDQSLFWGCIAACCVLFSVVYFIVYRMTSRVYYKIVHQR